MSEWKDYFYSFYDFNGIQIVGEDSFVDGKSKSENIRSWKVVKEPTIVLNFLLKSLKMSFNSGIFAIDLLYSLESSSASGGSLLPDETSLMFYFSSAQFR